MVVFYVLMHSTIHLHDYFHMLTLNQLSQLSSEEYNAVIYVVSTIQKACSRS